MEPFLYHHEREIDDFITSTHEQARAAGLAYIQQAIEYVKVKALGFPPRQPSPPPSQGQSYAQIFMSRLAVPSARGNNDLYSLVTQALSGAGALYGGNQAAQASELSRSSTLVPDNIRNQDDRLNYVATQRARLETLLHAFDQEQDNIRTQRASGSRYYEGAGGLSKSRSETEFDRIERDEAERPPYPITPPPMDRRTSQGGWMPWNYWQRTGRPAEEDPLAYGKDPNDSRGRSTGFDVGGR